MKVRTIAIGAHDDLQLPSGGVVRDFDDIELRRRLSQVMVVDHTLGRAALLEQYAQAYEARFNEGGRAAISTWIGE
jgi:hypothetical protein